MGFLKPITISLSPNTEKDDIFLAFKLLFQPWKWKKGRSLEELDKKFKNYLGLKHVFSFNSLRSALLISLKGLGFEKKDEILLQSFTCNAAANPIIWSGLKPVYVDCDEKTFNIDADDLKRKITKKSRAVVVQHTFGLPADLDRISEICRQNNLILIEDCAHSLGSVYKGRKIGTFGKISLFSFSRDKVISSVYGGMVVTNDDFLAKKIEEFRKKINHPSYFWTFQQLLHPVLMNWLILPTYRILGKYLLIFFQWFFILSKAVHWKEKKGKKPGYFPKKLPNALAKLAVNQFEKLDKFNVHRRRIANFYAENLNLELLNSGHIYLRFTIKNQRAHQIIKNAWKNNLLIGDWYASPVAPRDTNLEKLYYKKGSCPTSEKLSEETFNLPTHINISEKEAQEVLAFLKKFS